MATVAKRLAAALAGPGAPVSRRDVLVLAHLAVHPGLTAGELGRALGLSGSLRLLRQMEAKGQVIASTGQDPAQGRTVSRWRVAPPGTVPPSARTASPDAARQRERDRRSQRARRARARGLHVQPGMEAPSLRSAAGPAPDLPAAACRDADPGLFFPAEGERGSARARRVAKAKAVCASCPVRAGCYEGALARREPWGIWGGVDLETETAGRRRAS